MQEKTVLITGASSGIGEALAFYYATKGARLFLCGRDADRLQLVSQHCQEKGAAGVDYQVINVTDRAAMHQWITACDNQSPIDLLICNAGISGGTGGAELAKALNDSYKIFDANVHGVLNTIDPLLERFINRRGGQIAIVSSLASFTPWPNAPAYGASKAAVRLYGEGLRAKLSDHKIRVNVICPGFVKSRMTDVNNYKMPFLMDANKAAQIIAKGLEANKSRIAFPLPTVVCTYLLRLIPHNILIKMIKNGPAKNAMQQR